MVEGEGVVEQLGGGEDAVEAEGLDEERGVFSVTIAGFGDVVWIARTSTEGRFIDAVENTDVEVSRGRGRGGGGGGRGGGGWRGGLSGARLVRGDDNVVLDADDEGFACLRGREAGVMREGGEGERAVCQQRGDELLNDGAEVILHHKAQVVVVRRHGGDREWRSKG